MPGSAKLMLGRGTMSYAELKTKLIQEFGCNVSRQEIYNALRSRVKKLDESVRRYVMEMESLAMRSDVTDFELVAFVQVGLQGRIPNFILFAAAKTMKDIKNSIQMYEQRQSVRGDRASLGSVKPNVSYVKMYAPKTNNDDIRCYNCSKMGHMKRQCPYKRDQLAIVSIVGKLDMTVSDKTFASLCVTYTL